MLVDMVNQASQFLIFPVEIICIFLDHIAVMVEEVKELEELAFEQEFIVGFLFANQLQNGEDDLLDGPIAFLMWLDTGNGFEGVILQGLELEQGCLVQIGGS